MTNAEPEKDAPTYPSNELKPGTRLQNYRIKKVLGRGAFGITYLAEHVLTSWDVAIKEYLPQDFAARDKDSSVHPRAMSDKELFEKCLKDFLDEAKTLKTFPHENIVKVSDYFEQNDTAYLVMDYEVGQNLNQYFKQHPNLSESELLAIFTPINEGLALVHREGFIHRDIKPDNIFIREKDNSPVLLDFGAARDLKHRRSDELTEIFTPGYAPFEQKDAKNAHFRISI